MMRWYIFRRGILRRRWFFHLKAANGEIVLSSEGYRNRADAISTVKLIKNQGALAAVLIEPEE